MAATGMDDLCSQLKEMFPDGHHEHEGNKEWIAGKFNGKKTLFDIMATGSDIKEIFDQCQALDKGDGLALVYVCVRIQGFDECTADNKSERERSCFVEFEGTNMVKPMSARGFIAKARTEFRDQIKPNPSKDVKFDRDTTLEVLEKMIIHGVHSNSGAHKPTAYKVGTVVYEVDGTRRKTEEPAVQEE